MDREILQPAMSQENVEIVRRLFELFHIGMASADLGFWTHSEDLADDFEWIPPPGSPGLGVYRGPEGFLEFMGTWTEDFEDWSVELEQAFDAGPDRVVGVVRQRAVGKVSGAPVELHQGMVWEFEDGRVVRIRHFVEPSDALKAAGLSE